MTNKINFPLAILTSLSMFSYIISPVAAVLLQPGILVANAGQPFANIDLNTINGQTPPFTSCLVSPITITGSGQIDPAGQISQYKVQVVWANGDVENNIPITLLNNSAPYNYEFTAGPHTYATSASAITIKIYHVQPPGEDGQGDDSETIQVCITPEPPTTGTLTLIKEVDNGDGGTASEIDWTLSADGPTPIFGATGDLAITEAEVEAGTYTLAESDGPAGYESSVWSCLGGSQGDIGDTVTIAAGENVICTITNDDQTAHLALEKVVVNDGGGELTESDWTLGADGNGGDSDFSGPGPLVESDVSAGTYALSESSESLGSLGYTSSDWVCEGGIQNGSEITLDLGESATCTITNTYTIPGLSSIYGAKYDWDSEEGLFGWLITVIGNELPNFTATTTTNEDGEYGFINLDPGVYAVCETAQAGWEQMDPDTEDGCYEIELEESEESTGWDFWNRQMPQCANEIDDDQDGLTDNEDPGCYVNDDIANGDYDSEDNDEANTDAQCGNGLDDDDDGLIDSADPDCHADGDTDNPESWDPELDDENPTAPECSDDADNDGDGKTDELDPSCHTDGNPNNDDSYDSELDDESFNPDMEAPISAFDDSMDHRKIDTEMISLSLTGSTTDNTSGVATATMSIFRIADTNGENFDSAFAEMTCPNNAELVPIEIVALNLVSVNPLTVTWGHNYNLTNGVFCAEVHATDNSGNVENTATAGPFAYTYTAPTPPAPPQGGGSGGGGGGSSSGGQGGSINPGVGSPQPAEGAVLGASTDSASSPQAGQVLSESTVCSTEYLRDYIKVGKKNDPKQVTKLQEFLNNYEKAGLPVTGFYGPMTVAAVNTFQVKYWQQVLLPWVPHGLPTEKTSTSYVYKTTKRWINLMACPELNLVMPELP